MREMMEILVDDVRRVQAMVWITVAAIRQTGETRHVERLG